MRTDAFKSEKFEDRSDKPLQSAKSCTKHGFDHQATSNGVIRIGIWSPRFSSSLDGIPFLDRLFIKPKSDASSIHERSIIFFPVTGVVFVFLLGSHIESQLFVW